MLKTLGKSFCGVLLCGSLMACLDTNDSSSSSGTKHSVARRWNEVLLEAIRSDYARPTVHARNLFHISAAMYDAWAIYSDNAEPYFLGRTLSHRNRAFQCEWSSLTLPENVKPSQEEAMSYAAYRLILHRFEESPGATSIEQAATDLMRSLGLDTNDTSTNYLNGSGAALGNHIASCYISFGLEDFSNEANGYANTFYEPINPVIEPEQPGNPDIIDLDHWQAISRTQFIDQSGNPVNSVPEFLGPEWGGVVPFALTESELTIYENDAQSNYWVYHDPGAPPSITGSLAEEYKWGFSLVAIWSSHLDPNDETLIDISPASIGNLDIDLFPRSFEAFRDFYNTTEGGDPGQGYAVNPKTGAAYEAHWVKRSDYARVLAEFWADGPDSETPPGHWFVILNSVNDNPALEKRLKGGGEELSALEWGIKAYFTLGAAMHDTAISAWRIKGYYDYIRPVSAIRAMADRGQSCNELLNNYQIDGIPLREGYIEVVEEGDALAGFNNQNVGKIKLYAWRGPDYINNPATDSAGVGWILAENWWPYQRPAFVTPPFAGYVSGHSTYSRAAAEVLTRLTGDPYFPGGLGEFSAKANEFLVFEEGPSEDMILQWASYRDASDQSSLSRIWGGIHPPADDMPGRIIGERVGNAAYKKAREYY